jgi:8-oxo-dGTP pyrophosphatase MutT (NUDIX family)
MDGFSILNAPVLDAASVTQTAEYHAGHALGWLHRGNKQAATQHPLSGRLHVAQSGWLLLSVPNALVRGVYDALTAPGTELPLAGALNVPNVKPDVLNAHISVMTADEVNKIGADKISERGHTFRYALGTLKEVPVQNIDGVSKVWVIQVSAPELATLRKSYGLSPYPKGHPFHITVAVRRKSVLQENSVSKFDDAAGRGELKAAADETTTYDCNCSGKCTCPPTCTCKRYCCATKQAVDLTKLAPKWSERDHLLAALPQHLTDTQTAIQTQGNVDKEMTDLALIAQAWLKSQRQKELLAARVKKFRETAVYPSLAAPKVAAELPWRERVEILTRHPKTGKIYGGTWDSDKAFAAPGGGLDPGETPEQAAVRELLEETGIQAANPVRLPFDPVDNTWSDEYRQRTGRNFAGSRTHFVMADFVKKLRRKNLDAWSATNRGFYTPAAALQMMEGKQHMSPPVALGRQRALQYILDSAANKTAAADKLPGGEADGVPDSKFPRPALAEGADHEREHTDDDQIAKEIAKDHLSEDPRYYEKQKEVEKAAESPWATFVIAPHEKGYAATTRPTGDGKFGLPGGKLEPGEDPLAAVAREAREEGWDVSDLHPEPLHKGEVDGKPVWWYRAQAAQMLNDFKEKGRVVPTVARQQQLTEFGNDVALRAYLAATKKSPTILDELKAAKTHSDAKRYGHKHEILRRLMAQAPQDWEIDDDKPKYKGITHKPTKFRFHTAPITIPASVKKATQNWGAPQAGQQTPAQQPSMYWGQLKNVFNMRQPLRYDYNKTVFDNVRDHLQAVKQRGDFMLQANQNHEQYRAAVDPMYRHELARRAIMGDMPQQNWFDQSVQMYGDHALNTVFGAPK